MSKTATSKRHRMAAGLCIAAILLVVAGFWAALPASFGCVLHVLTRALGFEALDFEVRSVDWHRLELVDLYLPSRSATEADPGPDSARRGIEIARLVLEYSPQLLLQRRVEQIELSGVRIRAHLDQAGLSLGAIDAQIRRARRRLRLDVEPESKEAGGQTQSRDHGSGAGDLGHLPFSRLRMESARLELETPHGAVGAHLALDLSPLDAMPDKPGRAQGEPSGDGLEVPWPLNRPTHLELSLRDLSFERWPGDLAVRGHMNAASDGGVTRLWLPDGLTVYANTDRPEILAALGSDENLRALLGGPLAIDIAPSSRAAPLAVAELARPVLELLQLDVAIAACLSDPDSATDRDLGRLAHGTGEKCKLALSVKSSKLEAHVDPLGQLDATAGHLDLRLRARRLSSSLHSQGQSEIRLSGDFESDRESLALRLDKCGVLSLSELALTDIATSSAPLTLPICPYPASDAFLLVSTRGAADGDTSGAGAGVSLQLATEIAPTRVQARLRPPATTVRPGADDQGEGTPSAAPTEVCLEGTSPRLQVRTELLPASRSMELMATTTGGALSLSQLELAVSDFNLDLEWHSTPSRQRWRLDFEAGRARSSGTPPLFRPLSLTGRVEGERDDLRAHARLRDAHGALLLEAEARQRPAASRGSQRATGSAHLRLTPLRFEPGALQPADLFPAVGDLLSSVSGSIGAEAELRWGGGGSGELDGQLDLAIEALSFESAAARVEGLAGQVHLDPVWPSPTATRQELEIAILDIGPVLSDGRLVFSRRPDGRLLLDDMSFALFGGRLHGSGVLLSHRPAAGESTGTDGEHTTRLLDLRLEAIELAQLLERVDVEGLSGEGQISGDIPLQLVEERIQVRGGRLEAVPPHGRIRYRPGNATATALRGSPDMNLALRALEDFHFERLAGTLDGDLLGDVDLLLHLGGKNPALYGGHPIELNPSLLGLPLLKALRVFTPAQTVTERIERYLKQRRFGLSRR